MNVERSPNRTWCSLAAIAIGLMPAASCSGGGFAGLSSVPTSATRPQSAMSVVAPGSIEPSTRENAMESVSLCVGGTTYQTIENEDFRSGTLNYTPQLLSYTPSPNGAMLSSRANGFASDHSRNNIGTDDAYYTDPSRGFGGYNPYGFSDGALTIKAVPVPSPYATASPLLGAHWLSGLLESPAHTYGYVEISAKVPNLQGWWPAPLWLLGYAGDDGKGDGYEELDADEMFGTALPKSTVQQTQIFSPSGNPPANFVRTVVSPDPSSVFHTYGLLWTPQTVRFYIDRIERSPAWPNAANGPANAIMNLSVFTDHTWGPPPANKSPQTMYLQYFRWYQSQGSRCGPSQIATSLPTAMPTPSPEGTGVPQVVQNSGVIAYKNESTLLGQFAHVANNGDVLIAYVNAWTPVVAPTGWTRVDAPNNNGYFVFTGVVGKNGLPSSTAYPFGQNWGLIEVLDIRGASTGSPIIASADPDQYQPQFPRSLQVPKKFGLLLSSWGGFSYLPNGFTSIDEALPFGQAEKTVTYSLNNVAGNFGSFSLRVSEVTSEPYDAPQPFTLTASIAAQRWDFNGDLLWIPSTY